MFTLAIDTSDKHFSVALLQDEAVVIELDSRSTDESSRQDVESTEVLRGLDEVQSGGNSRPKRQPGVSVRLFPMLQQLIEQSGTKAESIDLIAIATGPGMFTGLRVGVVTAKTLAYVLGTPIVGVNTLEVSATRAATAAGRDDAVIHAVLNAQRQQLFAGTYRVKSVGAKSVGAKSVGAKSVGVKSGQAKWESVVEELVPNQILDRQDWLKRLAAGEIVTGTGLKPLLGDLEKFGASMQPSFEISDPAIWESTAVEVGHLGRRQYLAGRRDDLWKLEPFYFRPSYAEEN